MFKDRSYQERKGYRKTVIKRPSKLLNYDRDKLPMEKAMYIQVIYLGSLSEIKLIFPNCILAKT